MIFTRAAAQHIPGSSESTMNRNDKSLPDKTGQKKGESEESGEPLSLRDKLIAGFLDDEGLY